MKHTREGYTLLEILVAMTIIASVGILITQVFFTTTRSNTKSELLKDVKQNGDFAVESMTRMIRNSLGVESDCSPAGTTLNYVQIKNADEVDTTFGCVADSGVTRIASTSAASGASDFLTSSNVSLGGTTCNDSTLVFFCTSYTDEPSKISIQFQLSQAGVPSGQFQNADTNFETIVSPRN
ncbi:MAG TPA: prepilin-type N-terminal cleavage/methylation domain-containing protein [Patescibacteria group bacterium]|nr:prepilin-type N-terminal cleavage/methylation domain-containing protein [Patescibacteria group bacterium]